MTIEEFDNTKWTTGMEVHVTGINVEIVSVNLRTKEVCIFFNDTQFWFPCELVNLIEKKGDNQ